MGVHEAALGRARGMAAVIVVGQGAGRAATLQPTRVLDGMREAERLRQQLSATWRVTEKGDWQPPSPRAA